MSKRVFKFDTLPNGSAVWSLEGLIGAGKTTMIKSLLEDPLTLGTFDEVIQISEPLKAVTLKAYIKEMEKYATMFQVITLVKRINLYERARRLATDKGRRLILIDRGLDGDQAFEFMQVKKGFIDAKGHEIYLEEIGYNDGSLEKWKNEPGFTTIYLRCSPETAWRRTLARNIKEEVEGYNLCYMQDLYDAHEATIDPNAIVIDWEIDQPVDDDDKLSGNTLFKLLERIETQQEK